MGRREDRLARNEAVFREVNERVRAATKPGGVEVVAFICECGREDCVLEVQLSAAEYESVRSDPVQFAVALGHDLPEIEAVVSENERAAIVRKRPAEQEIPRRTDPRRA